jgi:hypothetical protein
MPMGETMRSPKFIPSSRAAQRGSTRGAIYIAPRNWLLTVVFAGLLAFWLLGQGGGAVEERAVRPLFDAFQGNRAQLVVLERPDAAAVQTDGVERSTLVLQPGGEGGSSEEDSRAQWVLEELFGAKAFSDRVERLLSRIGSMTTLDLVSADRERHQEYGLTEDRALRVRVSTTSEMGADPMVDLLLAPAPERAAWVRKSGENEVWRIARFFPPSPAPRAWFDDSSLMPLGDRAIRSIRAKGSALPKEVAINVVPGGERFADEAGVGWDVPRVLDLQRRLQTLFPINVTGAKAAGEPLDPVDSDGAAGEVGEGKLPWLSLEVAGILGRKSFRIELEEPSDSATECRAVLVEGTTRVTVAASTVRKIATALTGLLDAQDGQ